MIKVQKSKLIKIIRYDDDRRQINLRSNTHGCELVKLCGHLGDTKLEEHLKNSAKNAKYISKEIQNDLISCCGEVILGKIISAKA